MTRRYETLGRRILALLAEGGPRKRTVLRGVAGSEERLQRTLRRLLDSGAVVMLGAKRGTLYGLGRGKA